MPVREASARWDGPMPGGNGTMATASGAFEGGYSFGTRFEDEQGTNPEELIGAAHAGCLSMAFAGNLQRAGHQPESVETTAKVHIEPSGDGFEITLIELDSTVQVADIDEDEFQQIATASKEACPVSKALAAVDITLTAHRA
jgi:osmotically inducible protein OsmC